MSAAMTRAKTLTAAFRAQADAAGRSLLRSIRDKEKRWAKHEQEKARKRAEHDRQRALEE
jgi:hypothetical protein